MFFEDEIPKGRNHGPRGTMGVPARPDYKSYYCYLADGEMAHPDLGKASWCPSIHMPREAARLFLRVKRVSVERLQDISEADARAEGCSAGYETHGDGKFEDVTEHEWTAKEEFADIWDSIYAKRGFGWNINPWVWVVEFERLDGGSGV